MKLLSEQNDKERQNQKRESGAIWKRAEKRREAASKPMRRLE